MNPDTPNVLQAMMKLEQANARAKTANKVALEPEKEKDAAKKALEELKRQLQPKRARTDDDDVDPHDLLAEVDSWCQACSRVRAVGARHARVCEGEDLDPSRVAHISWWQAVRVLSRPIG